MSYREPLSQRAVAISISESPDMPALGLTDQHLRDAMAEVARHLLALGARLIYGGDLRAQGFTELLFELVARHRRDADANDERPSVSNYLAWPVHIALPASDLETLADDLSETAELICLDLNGAVLSPSTRAALAPRQATDEEWSRGLTEMRRVLQEISDARIVLGGRVDRYKGSMPGIAEEALQSLQNRQPLFLLGGFGGCARDIAEILGLIAPWETSRPPWPGRQRFTEFRVADLKNGLTADENIVLARTVHVDQAVTLLLRGLLRLSQAGNGTIP